MKKIKLRGKYGNGKFAIVDKSDFGWLNKFKWFVDSDGYPRKRNGYGHISMHTLLLPPQKGMIIDHRNQNKLDNRKENLRLVTHFQSTLNRGKFKNNKSGYRGVCWSKKNKNWTAQVGPKGAPDRYIGTFTDVIEAAKAADKKSKQLYGDFAQLNFKDEH